jgi:hypothetical protein
MARIELATSPLPRECSATELHGQAPFLYNNNSAIIPNSSSASKSGAGEGNRTLVVSLEGFCSTIELHPHIAIDLDMNQPSLAPPKESFPLNQVYCRRRGLKKIRPPELVEGEGFEPSKAEPSDLQSDPFDRSGTPPNETANCECFRLISQRAFRVSCTYQETFVCRPGVTTGSCNRHDATSEVVCRLTLESLLLFGK